MCGIILFIMARRKWHHHVHHFVVPHEGNGFRPGILSTSVIVAVLLIALVFEGMYLVGTKVTIDKTNFLASILPAALVSFTNSDRTALGLEEVEANQTLAAAAQLKADDMAEKGYFSHVSPDGTQPWEWIQKAGYAYTYAGENLAVNFEDSRDVEEAWMNSPSHRANIVKPQYTEVGIATARGTYKGKEATFVVQFFASPKIAAAATVAPTPTPTQVVAEPVPTEATVLGEETAPAPLVSLEDTIVQAAGSPGDTVTTVLAVVAVIVALMLLIALMAHVKLPYIEALGGTLVLLLIVTSMMAFNLLQVPTLEVPTDVAASAVLAF